MELPDSGPLQIKARKQLVGHWLKKVETSKSPEARFQGCGRGFSNMDSCSNPCVSVVFKSKGVPNSVCDSQTIGSFARWFAVKWRRSFAHPGNQTTHRTKEPTTGKRRSWLSYGCPLRLDLRNALSSLARRTGEKNVSPIRISIKTLKAKGQLSLFDDWLARSAYST